MLLVTLRNLLARKVRLLLSAFAIVLGIAFVAGSLVFTDTMSRVFANIVSGTVSDVNVRFTGAGDAGPNGQPTASDALTVPASVVSDIAALPGVQRADGQIQSTSILVTTKDGHLLGTAQAPTLTYNWTGTPNANGDPILTIVSGRAPTDDGEVVLDVNAAEKAGYVIGDTVTLATSTAEPEVKLKLVGTAEFTGGGIAGATLVVMSTHQLQAILFGGENVFTGISVEGKDGVSQNQLADQVAPVIPKNMEAITGDALTSEAQTLIGRLLGFFTAFLLIFAGISLVVGTFMILNTFSILVAQRSRELAMLRALGASKRQVTLSVLAEAFAVGLVGSTAGLALGYVLAWGLKFLFSQFGLDLSGTTLVLGLRTVVVSYAVGIVVTLVAALMPARRAASIAPVAAMRDNVAMPETSIRRRMITAAVFAAWGGILMISGVFLNTPQPTLQVGIGVFAVLLAVTFAAPLLSRPILDLAGRSFKVFGMVGHLATQNARRNPRRTAATASALMIGMALVTTIAILGSSVNTSIDAGVEEQFRSDLLVSNATAQALPDGVEDEVASVDGVTAIAPIHTLPGNVKDASTFVSAVTPADLQGVVKQDFVTGSAPSKSDEIAVSESLAKDQNIKVADTVAVSLNWQWTSATVTGIYPDSYLLGGVIADPEMFASVDIEPAATSLIVNTEPGANVSGVARQISKAAESYPTVGVQTKKEFADGQHAQVETLLSLVYALLGLAIVIAVLGIINTLSLSVMERTRELGLLRAVGLTRPQMRLAIRLESIAISVLGALLGVASGLLFGVVLQRVLADQGVSHLSIPVAQLTVFVVVSALVGVVAAVLPAWRASNLNVLEAIATGE